MTINRFWRALEDLIGCADSRYAWSTALDGGFEQVSFLLRSTGTLASTVSCPSPGGQFCPRQVCPDGDGAFVAVCGNRPAECSKLKLSLEDVRIYALDAGSLAGALASALSLRVDYDAVTTMRQTWRLGYCDVATGAAFPVYLSIQDSTDGYVVALARLQALNDAAFAMLVPTRRLLGDSVFDLTAKTPIDLIILPEIVSAEGPSGLACSARPETVFPKAWSATMPTEGRGENERAWVLPADVKWEELLFEFEAEQMLRITFQGMTKKFEPIDLHMRNNRDKVPNLQWTLLRSFAIKNGVIEDIAPRDFDQVQSQKRQLSNRLQAAFGIPDDPIPWNQDEKAYRTRFRIRGDKLRDRR